VGPCFYDFIVRELRITKDEIGQDTNPKHYQKDKLGQDRNDNC